MIRKVAEFFSAKKNNIKREIHNDRMHIDIEETLKKNSYFQIVDNNNYNSTNDNATSTNDNDNRTNDNANSTNDNEKSTNNKDVKLFFKFNNQSPFSSDKTLSDIVFYVLTPSVIVDGSLCRIEAFHEDESITSLEFYIYSNNNVAVEYFNTTKKSRGRGIGKICIRILYVFLNELNIKGKLYTDSCFISSDLLNDIYNCHPVYCNPTNPFTTVEEKKNIYDLCFSIKEYESKIGKSFNDFNEPDIKRFFEYEYEYVNQRLASFYTRLGIMPCSDPYNSAKNNAEISAEVENNLASISAQVNEGTF